ncbi:MAG: hypothetical protein LLG04_03675 [Parachlamydia sp.]|nr:hypothetical protein [Parachlamydia sp.]
MDPVLASQRGTQSSVPDQSKLSPATGKAAAKAQDTFATTAPGSQSALIPSERYERCLITPFKIHNALCMLQNCPLVIYNLLLENFPQGQTVNWIDLQQPSIEGSEVAEFPNMYPDYKAYQPATLAKMVRYMRVLDQTKEKCPEGVLRAFNLLNRSGELHVAAQSLIEGDAYARGIMKELSENSLISVCLFALSIPSTASCFAEIRTLIENKLREDKLVFNTDNLWGLCQQLQPQMRREDLGDKLAHLAHLASYNVKTYDTLCAAIKLRENISFERALERSENREQHLPHMLHVVAQITRSNPVIENEFSHWLLGSNKETKLLCFALALTQVGSEGAHFQEWCELVKTKLKSTFNIDCAELNLDTLDRCKAEFQKKT